MSGLDIAISVFQALNVPSVTSLLDGGKVYKFNRPINSPNKDIIIDVNGDEDVNINIHLPNLELHDDQTFPDTAEFKVIADAILNIIGVAENTAIPIRDSDGQWYVNIKMPVTGNVVPVQLFEIFHIDDGYGGFTPSMSSRWSGLGYKSKIADGSQENIEAGVYRLNQKCTWVLPDEAAPRKNMELHAADGEYVINGINEGWAISTVRKDG